MAKKFPKGATPTALPFRRTQKAAYVTNGGTNNVAVISLTGRRPVVTGTHSDRLAAELGECQPDGSTLYVVNARATPAPMSRLPFHRRRW